MDKASMLLGYLVGRQIAGQRRTQEKKPIAYLYNGVQLPLLPEWDRKMYPYAHIAFSDSRYFVYIFSQPPTTWKRTDYFPTTNTYEVNGMKSGIWNAAIHDPDQNIWYDFGEPNDNQYGWNKLTNIVWANYGVNSVDGTLFMAASEPIPIYSEPVNYLYNGVKLPKLPEWDKTVYPYAVIAYAIPDEMYFIFISTAPMYVNTDNFFACSADLTASLCTINSGVWELGETIDFGAEDLTYPMSYLKMTWSSYDVLWDDGSVYSASSDPIPVYNTGQTETVVYDDTWPIEWVPSAMTNNLKYYDIVKVSNLTPTAEKMQSAVLTLENQVFNCTSTNTAMDGVTVYVYTDADGSDIALFVVSDNSLTDTGLYATDLGDNDCKLTLSL